MAQPALQMPVLSTLAVPLYDSNTGIWELVCGSFQQYIINMSHLLEFELAGLSTGAAACSTSSHFPPRNSTHFLPLLVS